MKKPALLIVILLLVVGFLLKDTITQRIASSPGGHNHILMVFEEGLTSQQFEILSDIISKRLQYVKIKHRRLAYQKDTIRVWIRNPKDLQKAANILTYQGLFRMQLAYSNTEMYPILSKLNDDHEVENDMTLFRTFHPCIKGEIGEYAEPLDGSVIGHSLVSDSASLMRFFNAPNVRSEMRLQPQLFTGKRNRREEILEWFAVDTTASLAKNLISEIKKVTLERNPKGAVHVQALLHEKEAIAFMELTRNNQGKHVAFILDHCVLWAPEIVTTVPNGLLTLSVKSEEPDIIAGVLHAGKAYPHPVKQIQIVR
jgi:preprotein translocase subunit SecD